MHLTESAVHMHVARAKAGDQRSLEILMDRWTGLAIHIGTHGLYLAGGEHDDLRQAARLGLWDAIRHFDAARSEKFATWALPVVRRKCMTEVTRSRAKKHEFLNDAAPLFVESDEVEDEFQADDHAESALAEVEDRDRNNLLLAEFRRVLGKRERQCLDAMIELARADEDIGPTKLAERLGWSLKQADNAMMRIRAKAKWVVEVEPDVWEFCPPEGVRIC